MEYRYHSKIKKPLSLFGLGCMRLPTIKKNKITVIDEEQAIQMLRHGIDHGVNYIDTAYNYHGGNSERVVGKALKDGYRAKVFLATKLPSWLVKEANDFERIFNEQLQRLDTDHVDFYLLHSLNKNSWENLKNLGVLDFLKKIRKQGKIKYICFSFHDTLDVFKSIIDSFDWDMCQIQLNIMDMHEQAGVEGLKYAGLKNIPVVIMEPLKGGKLARGITPEIEAIWDQSEIKRTPVEWAFRWLYNFPEVFVILSGVNNLEQLQDNLRIFEDAKANCMTLDEQDLVHKVRAVYLQKTRIQCTGCNYCQPCPQGVLIPEIFNIVNNAFMYNEEAEGQKNYLYNFIKYNKDASQCIECGNCEAACPQNIPIIEKLKESHEYLTHK